MTKIISLFNESQKKTNPIVFHRCLRSDCDSFNKPNFGPSSFSYVALVHRNYGQDLDLILAWDNDPDPSKGINVCLYVGQWNGGEV